MTMTTLETLTPVIIILVATAIGGFFHLLLVRATEAPKGWINELLSEYATERADLRVAAMNRELVGRFAKVLDEGQHSARFMAKAYGYTIEDLNDLFAANDVDYRIEL